ncbi:MAG: BatA domain-containing protein [Planctomycetaceae bacterium]
MFDLLTPIFATAGIVAAAVPFVLHMLRRTPSRKLPFSLVRFLKPSLPKMTKRSTIEHWPLMLLRILALILIGLAFSRPFQRVAVEGTLDATSARRVAVLVDVSASMRRDGLREQAIQHLRDVVAGLSESDVFSLSAFSQTTRTLISSGEWSQTEVSARAALIEEAVEAIEPDWLGTHTGAALLNAAAEVSQEEASGPRLSERRVVLITDFQRGSGLEELQSAGWPDAVHVDLKVVRPEVPGNAGISLLPEDRDGQPRILLSNSIDSVVTDFAMQPFDREGNPVGKPIRASVAAGQRHSVVMPVSDDKATAVIAGVELLQDKHPFDNVVDLPVIENPLLKVAHVGSVDSNDPAEMKYYLQRAIDGNESEPFELIDAAQADGVLLPVASDVRLIVVTDVLPKGLLPSVSDCLNRGGTVLVALKSTEVASSVSSLLPDFPAVSESSTKDYAMLGQIEFDSSLFAAFSEARFSDFSSIRFWHHRIIPLPQIESRENGPWRVIAKFDSGDPAIVETSLDGGGRIIIFTAGWHPDDSQWALSTRFAPMITSLVRQSYPRSTGQMVFSTGDAIIPGHLTGSNEWSLQLPDDSVITSESLRKLAESRQTQPISIREDGSSPTATRGSDSEEFPYRFETPGRYLLSSSGDKSNATGRDSTAPERASEVISMIVGLPLTESRTDPLPLGQLQALGLEADASDGTLLSAGDTANDEFDPVAASQLTSSELESRQKLWRWLLLAGLGCLMLESLVSGGIERRQSVEATA